MSIDPADRVRLTGDDVEKAGLADWRFMFVTIEAVFDLPSYAVGLELVAEIGAAAEEADHHPDLLLRWGRLVVKLMSHDAGGVTHRDLRLAERISELAAGRRAVARPELVQVVEIALDTADRDEIRPFWAAVLGVPDRPEQPMELVDPDGRVHTLWFQESEPHDLPRQRFHYDVRVAHDTVEARIDAAVAAGGTLVDDGHAPAFWVLADPQGNKACLTTWQGRG